MQALHSEGFGKKQENHKKKADAMSGGKGSATAQAAGKGGATKRSGENKPKKTGGPKVKQGIST